MIFSKLNLPLQLLLVLVGVFLFGNLIPEFCKSCFYSISLQLQEILIFFLPFIIFSYIFACLTNFENNVLLFIAILLGLVVISNFISVLYAYGVGIGCLSYLGKLPTIAADISLSSLGNYKLPKIPNNYALLSGLVVGTFFFYYRNPLALKLAIKMRDASNFFLRKMFVPLMPLFVLGFMLKMQHEGLLETVLESYGPILISVVVAQLIYIGLFFGVAANFRMSSWKEYLKNAFPSAVMGFSTMSSAATMPLVLQGAETSTKKPSIVQACIPATINIHLIGDGIAMPILMMATLVTFGHPLPDMSTYLIFSGYYVLQKFAAAAVPGGGIIILIPILQGFMCFDEPMQGFITTIYIFFDPFITLTNVMCNGAFAIIFARIFGKIG
jgi:hypothetical protein